jgi:hypothetical protein
VSGDDTASQTPKKGLYAVLLLSSGQKGCVCVCRGFYVVECVLACLCYTEGKSKRTLALTVRRGKNKTTSRFEVRLERQGREVSNELRSGAEGMSFGRANIHFSSESSLQL